MSKSPWQEKGRKKRCFYILYWWITDDFNTDETQNLDSNTIQTENPPKRTIVHSSFWCFFDKQKFLVGLFLTFCRYSWRRCWTTWCPASLWAPLTPSGYHEIRHRWETNVSGCLFGWLVYFYLLLKYQVWLYQETEFTMPQSEHLLVCIIPVKSTITFFFNSPRMKDHSMKDTLDSV